MAVQEISLSRYPWYWKEEGSNSSYWVKTGTFPTVIHYELEEAKLINDIFVSDNERRLQWVGERDWSFKALFPTPKDAASYSSNILALDGLDTVAKVMLNGETILECDNMFIPHRVDVKGRLKQDGENELYIIFWSNVRVALEREKKYGAFRSNIRNTSRLWMRKGQFHWGWDWGPREVTAGPYKDIRLELFGSRITDLYAHTKLAYDLRGATVTIEATVEGDSSPGPLEVSVEGPGLSGLLTKSSNTPQDGKVKTTFEIDNPQLWWPYGHGGQPLYKATAKLSKEGNLLHEISTTFGIRSIKLIQRPLKSAPGETFFFEVNKKPIYICGTNWVPAHNQTPKITEQIYHKWITWARMMNNNMIRIWGGGIFEGDAFYEACDRQGVLIWHDFMTACGVYPVEPWILKSVEEEVRAQVTRLRSHPSIAIWCGNNEDFMVADYAGVKYDVGDLKGPWDKTEMPQREWYMRIWPNICKELTPEIPYWPSSPFGGPHANHPDHGDLHQWDVWHHLQLPYQQYPKLGGRFVSEFGMHGFPNERTVRTFAPDPKSWYPNSRIMDTHNKSKGAENKMGRYLWENFHMPTTMPGFIYLSQLLQSEALDYALIHWRREWKGPGNELCAGSMIWQLNDSNPTTSWALVDHYFRPKPAFFTVRRAFAPISVGISRTPVWHFLDENNPHETDIPTFELWGCNFTDEDRQIELRLRVYDVAYGKEINLEPSEAKQTFILKPNISTELTTLKSPPEIKESSYVVLSATLHDPTTGEEIARKVSWPEPYRYLDLPNPKDGSALKVVTEGEGVEITCGAHPLKGVLAYVDIEDGEDADWAENMWDMMPGETVRTVAKGLSGRKVHVRHLATTE